jgi:hypothetical protein
MWQRLWYNNNNFSTILKKTQTFESLIKVFFTYGLFINSNIFLQNFWYKTITAKKFSLSLNSPLYFRKYFYSHKTLAIDHSYYIRQKTPEFFPMRLYILRYNNWLVTSIQWFKPLKSTESKFFKKNYNVGKYKNPIIHAHKKYINQPFFYKNMRLKLIIKYISTYILCKTNTSYKF